MLNPELVTSSVIAGLGCFVVASVALELVELKRAFVCIQLSQVFMIAAIVFAFRPMMIWMIKHTTERKPLKASYRLLMPGYMIIVSNESISSGLDSKTFSLICGVDDRNWDSSEIFNWRGVFHHQGFGFTFSLSYYAPIVRAIYDTLRRHMTYHKRTIQHSKRHSELRIMHSRTSTWENLSISPPQQTTSWMSSINTRNKDKRLSRRQCFTSLAPYSLMHDDICSLGHEKCTALVIVPFQKSDTVYISVRVIFLGGPDDSEALAYSVRMAEHPRIRASVLVVQQQGVVVEQVE
ncbi:hypothetical protein JRO89_XS12G0075100 [Xanthoceras sorbifolium]|uniref:Cation/H(+) antiporter C-terminal domain-containing protein n=1 Tax=Xanthoceras sorbifolium TaxID=99658 RepID=A0ABQ8HBP0_9ROSI|nr:hypothetical protein JRO89_XS12G0075100 [Xanthoceras sorbifolium]